MPSVLCVICGTAEETGLYSDSVSFAGRISENKHTNYPKTDKIIFRNRIIYLSENGKVNIHKAIAKHGSDP